jgi:aryl-alcohol dehydrogenase-like predicted oxidoreductase
MKYRRLGATGLNVSEISLGGWITHGGALTDEQAHATLDAAWEAGINLYDTADVYAGGRAEETLGRWLKNKPREQAVVATKMRGRMWDGPNGEGLSKKRIKECVEHSLRRLQTDYIDIYQMHWPDQNTPIEETVEGLERVVREGKVLYPGLSNYDTEQVREAIAAQDRRGYSRFVSHQPVYNLLDRGIEQSLMPLCANEGIGFIVYSPLAQGFLSEKYLEGQAPEGTRGAGSEDWQRRYLTPRNLDLLSGLHALAQEKETTIPRLALAWILSHPEITSCIIGATRPEQVAENAAATDVALEAGDASRIRELLDARERAA